MKRSAALVAGLLLAGAAAAQEPMRIVGYNDMRDMLEPLVRVFEEAHPGLRVELSLPGTRFAPAALARGESMLAPMGALFTPPQLADYRRIVGADPVAFRVAHASLDARALSGPLAIVVHRDNPLGSLTLEQAADLFSGRVRTWGDLGLHGEWSSRPIVPYGLHANTALALEFRADAMGTRNYVASMKTFPQSADVVKAVTADRDGIGFTAAMRAWAGTRIVAIATTAHDAAVLPTRDTIGEGRYPLDRYLLIYVKPPLSPLVRDFLRLALSQEGQRIVAATPQRYIPLSSREVKEERARLDTLNPASSAPPPPPSR